MYNTILFTTFYYKISMLTNILVIENIGTFKYNHPVLYERKKQELYLKIM